MRSFLKLFFALLLSVVFILAIFAGILVYKSGGGGVKIKDHSYLALDIYGEIPEYHPPESVMGEVFGGKPETLQRLLDNLEKARYDKRIDGVILKISSSNNLGLAKIEELRGAIKKVRKAGKEVLCFTDSMDRNSYYLASACDSIFATPSASFIFIGFSSTSEHVKGTLEKLKIKAHVHKIKDYKSAAEMITRKNMSKYARENRDWLLNEFWDMFCSALEKDRGFSEEKVIGLMEHALFTAQEAREVGLVDKIYYWDELERSLKGKEEKLRIVSSSEYERVEPKKLGIEGKKKIAVIHALGMIGGRTSRLDPILGPMIGHETVCEQFRKAREDKDVVAIVFRVDSPGGEGLASDLMSREVEVTQEKIPVVVSMVDVAASGGYYISYKAKKIVADPMTITGSIGSISAKFSMEGFFGKLGITYDFVTKGPNALFMSELKDFTDEQWEIFKTNHWAGFNRWLADVAEKRGMSFTQAEKLAHGRVWSGRQAVENGLVDELGGLDRAVEIAKELAGLSKEEKVKLVHYPKKRGLFEILLGKGGGTSAIRWIMYSFVHNELRETWNSLSKGQMYLFEPGTMK